MFDIFLTSSSDISWKVEDDDEDDDGEEMLGKKFPEETKAGGDIILAQQGKDETTRLLQNAVLPTWKTAQLVIASL